MYYDDTAPATYSVLASDGYVIPSITLSIEGSGGLSDVVIINGVRYVRMVVQSRTDNYPGGCTITASVWMEPATDKVYDQLDLIHGFNVVPNHPKYYPLLAIALAGIRLWPQARAPPARCSYAPDF